MGSKSSKRAKNKQPQKVVNDEPPKIEISDQVKTLMDIVGLKPDELDKLPDALRREIPGFIGILDFSLYPASKWPI